MRESTPSHHISIITRNSEQALLQIRNRIEDVHRVDGRSDLEELLGTLLSAAGDTPPPTTLDLIGHSGARDAQLELGDWTIDAAQPSVAAFFRGLADQDVFRRLGIAAIRLLGCETARTKAARSTLLALADITGLDVLGTRTMTYAAHYDERGFATEHEYLLVSAAELREQGETITPAAVRGEPWPRSLDVESLPSSLLAALPAIAWPRAVASLDEARELLRLVDRNAGGKMPGLLATPMCELAMPAIEAGRYWRAQVLLDGAMLRVFPSERDAGVCFATTEPAEVRELIARIAPANGSA
jgi:hypothetical protein